MVDAFITCLVFGYWVRLLWEALVLHTSWVVCDGAVRSQVTGPVGPQEWMWTDSGVHLVWHWICVWFQAGPVCLLLKVTADVVAAGSWPRPGVNMSTWSLTGHHPEAVPLQQPVCLTSSVQSAGYFAVKNCSIMETNNRWISGVQCKRCTSCSGEVDSSPERQTKPHPDRRNLFSLWFVYCSRQSGNPGQMFQVFWTLNPQVGRHEAATCRQNLANSSLSFCCSSSQRPVPTRPSASPSCKNQHFSARLHFCVKQNCRNLWVIHNPKSLTVDLGAGLTKANLSQDPAVYSHLNLEFMSVRLKKGMKLSPDLCLCRILSLVLVLLLTTHLARMRMLPEPWKPQSEWVGQSELASDQQTPLTACRLLSRSPWSCDWSGHLTVRPESEAAHSHRLWKLM